MIRRIRPVMQTSLLPSQAGAPRLTPYDNRYQPDIGQMAGGRAAIRYRERRGLVHSKSADRGEKSKQNYTYPGHIQMTSFQVFVNTTNPTRVLANNRNRSRFILVNTTGTIIYFSFNQLANQATNSIFGIPLADQTVWDEGGDTICVDDIYVICPAASALNVLAVLVYEGQPN